MLNVNRRKKEAREAHRRSKFAQRVHGLRAKLHNQKRFKEKVEMKKTCVQHRWWSCRAHSSFTVPTSLEHAAWHAAQAGNA